MSYPFKQGDVVRVIGALHAQSELVGRMAIVRSYTVGTWFVSLEFEDRTRFCSLDLLELVEPIIAETYRAQRNCPF